MPIAPIHVPNHVAVVAAPTPVAGPAQTQGQLPTAVPPAVAAERAALAMKDRRTYKTHLTDPGEEKPEPESERPAPSGELNQEHASAFQAQLLAQEDQRRADDWYRARMSSLREELHREEPRQAELPLQIKHTEEVG